MRITKRIAALLLALVMSAFLAVPAFAVTAGKRHSGIYIGAVTFNIYDYAYSKPYYSYTRPASVDVSIFEINGEITYCLEPFQPSEVDARYQESGFPSYMTGRDTAVLRALCYGAPANGDDSDAARVATQLLVWDMSMGYADGQWNWISPDGAKPPFYAAAEELLPEVKAAYDTVVAALKANSGLPAGVERSDMHVWDDDGTYSPRLQTMVSIDLPVRGTLRLMKTSEDGNVAGIAFTVTGPDGYSATAETDANGTFTLTDLSPGTYTVTENVPSGYQAQEPRTVTIGPGETGRVTFNNRLRRGSVHLTKTSEDGNVAGIAFTVTGPDGYSATAETDANGTFTLTDLYPGTYTVTENVPSDYQAQEPQTVTIGPGETGTVTFRNLLKRGSVRLTKTSEDGNVAGITFTVTGPDGYSAAAETYEDGTFTLTDLYPGTYTVTENVPRGYDPQEPQTVTIGPGETGTVSFHNRLSRADIRVIKVDGETGEPLAGAGFRLFDASGTAVAEGLTDENGILTFEDLVLGEYSCQEYQAPAGFVPDDTVWPVTLDTGGVTVTHTRENTPRTGSISVHKINASGTVLPGTELMLQSSADDGVTWEDVESRITDENGDAVWTDLPVRGVRYRIIETGAVPGSSLMTKPVWEGTLPVPIDGDDVPEGADAEIVGGAVRLYDLHITAINTPVLVLPFTGSRTMAVCMSLAMLAACAGICYLIKTKEEICE